MPKFNLSVTAQIEAKDLVGAAKHANSVLLELEKQGFTNANSYLGNQYDDFDGAGNGSRGPRSASGEDRSDRERRDISDNPEDRREDRGSAEAERVGQQAGDGEGKRKPGRPRKSDGGAGEAGSGSSSGERRDDRSGDARSASEGRGRDEPRGTEQGSREGSREGEGRGGSSGRGGNDRGRDREKDRVSASDEDWNDGEPAYTVEDLQARMTDLYKAMGGKATRQDVRRALQDIAGVDQPRDVPSEGIAKVIDGLEHEIKAYESGKKSL